LYSDIDDEGKEKGVGGMRRKKHGVEVVIVVMVMILMS